jgi:tRNA(Arg) A34 adenosine deaminase TadA
MQFSTGRPADAYLTEFAPGFIWKTAFWHAENGPLLRYNVGAVIFDQESGRILSAASNSFSPESPRSEPKKPAIHAEVAALSFLPRTDLNGATVLTVALKKNNGGHCASSQPCAGCLSTLAARGVDKMIFVERGDNGWNVHQLAVEEHSRRHQHHSTNGVYARMLRLPRLTPLTAG